MTQQALYRKWRSRSFDELVGQRHVAQTLRNALESGRVAHAYIFSGPRGTGKTTSARILAKLVNCLAEPEARPCNECHICRSINDGSALDLIEIDAASNTQVDKVRDVIVEKINYAPSEGRMKVYLIDEVHMLSNSAFNALLKTIEEPPPHAMFVLATTEIHKIPATILSRCQRLDFHRISIEEMVAHLAWVVEQEGITADPEVFDLVARQATGSMRDALSLLDQLLAYGGEHLTLRQARAALGLAATEAIQVLLDYLLAQDVGGALQLVNRLIDQGTDPRQFLADVLEQMRALLLTLAGGEQRLLNLPDEQMRRLKAQARHITPPALIEIIRLFNQAGADLKLGLQPQLPLELAIIEAVLTLQRHALTPASAPAPLPERVESAPPTPAARQRARPKREVKERAAVLEAPAPTPAPPEPLSRLESVIEAEEEEIDEAPVLEEVEPEPTPATSEYDLMWWRQEWEPFKEFLANRGEEGRRSALRLKFCEPHTLEGQRLTLGFFYTLHLEKIQKREERMVVEQALSAFRGAPMTLQCELVPKAQPLQAGKTKYEQAAEDPLVREASKQGGRIVEVYLPDQS